MFADCISLLLHAKANIDQFAGRHHAHAPQPVSPTSSASAATATTTNTDAQADSTVRARTAAGKQTTALILAATAGHSNAVKTLVTHGVKHAFGGSIAAQVWDQLDCTNASVESPKYNTTQHNATQHRDTHWHTPIGTCTQNQYTYAYTHITSPVNMPQYHSIIRYASSAALTRGRTVMSKWPKHWPRTSPWSNMTWRQAIA